MYRFLIFLFVLLLSIWIGVQLTTDPGYLLISWHQFALEMPLWLAVLIISFSFILIYYFIRFFTFISMLPKQWHQKLEKKRLEKTTMLTDQRLFSSIYQKPHHWHSILKILPQLENKTWISSHQFQQLQQESYEGLLNEEKYTSDLATLEQLWNNLPPKIKKDPLLLNDYIQGLINHHQDAKAESLIIKQLKKQWFGPLAATYSLIKSPNPTHQLAITEKWLKKHPSDPYLLLSLGRLCRHRKLWGKAQDYLEKSLNYDPSNAEVYLELGQLFEDTEEPFKALICFKKGLTKYIQK
ncbi:heme biosynthesis HemY N-terminal domain-containing protein [Rickettsiella grylli]|uniref:HemY protein n=1 Tax=Rickettsiella grylli TaxID=59196 RepID=A8PKZ0_9COXI|nr:heme biosynthesis HemY N-terminal domain-containing protein [Rickettsiella grylli]EDP46246.1 HemY protein [Rickettsiella grylli]